MKILDESAKKTLLKKLAGLSSETNRSVYEFALALAKELNDIEWNKSGGKMNFLNNLVNQPDIYIKDAGCLRQMIMAGNFIEKHYEDKIDKLSSIGYWAFHKITRARLSQNESKNLERKIQLIEKLLNKELKEGKLNVEINKIKDNAFPKALEDVLQWYNVWNFSKLDRRFGIEYPGQIPGQIIINLIYHYVEKNSVIVDPLAGGGVTQDVCNFFNNLEEEMQTDIFPVKKYNLKCHSFDLVSKRDFIIKKNSMTEDWNIDGVDFVFLDPPYFSMMKNDYIENEFTYNRKSFYNAVEVILEKSYNALRKNGICALLIQPQTEKDLLENEVCIDLPFECYKIMEKYFKPYQRVQVALSTQQFMAIDLQRAQQEKNRDHLLGISRDLLIMKKE